MYLKCSHSASSFGGDGVGLIPNIRFSLEKDPFRFKPDDGIGCEQIIMVWYTGNRFWHLLPLKYHY